MARRIGFVITVLAAQLVVACGRQVTPNPAGLGPGGAPAGYVEVFFNTQAPFNFSNYKYIFVFNTSGSGVTPSTDTIQTNWAGYSYALVALGNGVSTYAEPVMFRVSPSNPHVPPYWQVFYPTPQQFSYNFNANGTGTEFSILAQKRILASPMPSPSPTSNVWTFNAFTAQAVPGGEWTFYDSMGAGGPTDPQYVSPKLNMLQCFDNTYYASSFVPPDPAAQILSVEIINNPAANPCTQTGSSRKRGSNR